MNNEQKRGIPKSYPMMRWIVLLMVMVFVSTVSFAQSGTISGKVLDETGEPVIGANVTEKGTTNGTITDFDGNFTISISSGSTLLVSYIGYLPQEIRYTGQATVVVSLKEDLQNLDEVIVVGYGTQKKVNVTGSVANVDNKLFENRPLTNVSAGLQGLLPGVAVTQSSGQPGSDTGTIRIRGVGTLNYADPMIIVDGVESTMNDIDPNDIETISVLKDAASSSIYGSKAANGVMVITTKRGKSGKSSVNYTANFGIVNATRLSKYFSSAQVAEYWNAALVYENGPGSEIYTAEEIRKYADGSDPYNYPNTDWQSLLYRTAFQQSHNINVSGGNETARYMASVGYQGQDGIIDNFGKNQYNMRLNLDMNPMKNLETNFSLSYTQQDIWEPGVSYGANEGNVYQLLRLVNRISPMVVGKYENGDYGAVSDGNPLAWIESGAKKQNKIHNLLAVASAKYNILPSLSIKAQASYKLQYDDEDFYNKAVRYNDTYTQGETYKEIKSTFYDRVTADILPEFSKSFGNHNLNVLGGFHSELYKYKYTYSYRKDFPNSELTDLNAGSEASAKAEGYTRELAMISWFGRFNYDYAGKYLFEANIRRDGSSRFSKDNRWGTFPSLSAGWRMSEEDFFDNVRDKINNLKWRGSWGKLGNQEIGTLGKDDANQLYPTVPTMTLGKDYVFGGTNLTSGAQTYYAVNQDLKWEATTMWGFGLDLSLIHKINFTADYYNKTTTGVLMEMSTSSIYALNNYYANQAEFRNSGVELSIQYMDRFGEVGFTAGGNVSFNNNKVLNMGVREWEDSPANDNFTAVNWVGHAMNSYYGYKTAGIFQTQQEIDNWASYSSIYGNTVRPGDLKYVDVDDNGRITADDRIVMGSMDPKIVFGFNVGATWREFDISMFFQGAGNVYRMITDARGGLSNSTNKPNELWLDSWTETNKGAKYPRLADVGPNGNESDFWLQNSSYLRMKDLQIGYTFPRHIMSKAGISRLRIYYSGQNLFTITGMLKGWDPEAPSGRGNGFPQTMVNSFGLNLTF